MYKHEDSLDFEVSTNQTFPHSGLLISREGYEKSFILMRGMHKLFKRLERIERIPDAYRTI